MVGKSFPDYRGLLTKTTIATHCFRCGNPAIDTFQMADGGYIGACRSHAGMLYPSSSTRMIPDKDKHSHAGMLYPSSSTRMIPDKDKHGEMVESEEKVVP
jgi:hypothetical protein